MIYKPPYIITSKILALVSDIVERLGDIKYLESQINTPQLRKINRIKTITGTLQIEGNTFTEEKVTAILEGKRVLGTLKEVSEVLGAIKAYDKLDRYSYKQLKDLLDAHQLLMGDILTHAGDFRVNNVGVHSASEVIHIAPPASRVPTLMQELFNWLKTTDEHPLVVSSVFHYEFEFIHPFSDGNGRMGRLWQSVILHHWKPIFSFIPIESVVRDNQDRYYQALEEAGSLGESTPFVEFMLEMILESIENIVNKTVPKNVPKNVPLKRLDKILALIQKNRNITLAQMADILKVSNKTIQRDILKLKKSNKIKRLGSLKSGYWEILKVN